MTHFQNWKWHAFSLILPYFSRFFSALKVKRFQPDFTIFFTHFFTNSENATKSDFSQETLIILSALKFTWHFMTEKSVSAWFHQWFFTKACLLLAFLIRVVKTSKWKLNNKFEAFMRSYGYKNYGLMGSCNIFWPFNYLDPWLSIS